MSLNPSNLMTARANPGKVMFTNLARHRDCSQEEKEFVDSVVLAELAHAKIPTEGPAEFLRDNREVPAAYLGSLYHWSFRRAWYYWIAEGPDIPPEQAEKLHAEFGTQCRVNGHCGCPSPLEQNHGFAVGLYHVDTQVGLNALADVILSVYRE